MKIVSYALLVTLFFLGQCAYASSKESFDWATSANVPSNPGTATDTSLGVFGITKSNCDNVSFTISQTSDNNTDNHNIVFYSEDASGNYTTLSTGDTADDIDSLQANLYGDIKEDDKTKYTGRFHVFCGTSLVGKFTTNIDMKINNGGTVLESDEFINNISTYKNVTCEGTDGNNYYVTSSVDGGGRNNLILSCTSQ